MLSSLLLAARKVRSVLEEVKRQRTTSRAQSWSLVLPQNEMTWTRTLNGCRFQVAHVRWGLHVGVWCWRCVLE